MKRTYRTTMPHQTRDFEMTLNGTLYDEKKSAGEMLLAFAKQAFQLGGQVIGTYKGFDMTINTESLLRTEPYIELRGAITHQVYLGDDALGNMTSWITRSMHLA